MPDVDAPTTLADQIQAAARENATPAREPDPQEAAQDAAEPPGDFRRNALHMFDLMDRAVADARKTTLENAHLRARHEQEVKAHIRTMEMLRAAESITVELREQLSQSREANIRLQAHMETMGNNILTAARDNKA